MDNSSKRILITGAGSGLGLALARAWAAEGCRVAVTDVDLERAQTARDGLPGASDSLALRLDVLSDADFAAVAQEVQSAWGGVDVVVNNAGVGSAGTVQLTPMSEWSRVIEINLLAVARGCKNFLPTMLRQGSGHFVNIASFAGIANAPGMAAYNAAKAGVISLSESLRQEVLDSGIGVSVACPSFFKTNLVSSMTGQDDQVKSLVNRLMDKASVTADDVARDIVDAVERNRFLVITHRDMRWMERLRRWQPRLFFRLVRRGTRGLLASGE